MTKQDLSALAVLAVVVLAVLAVVRATRAKPTPQRDTPTPPPPSPDDAEPVCRTRGCSALATRGMPELRPWRPFPWLLPRWEVVTDPEADAALCAAHHGAAVATLAERAAQERAAIEAHVAARHRDLVAWMTGALAKELAIAPQTPRPSPLRGSPQATAVAAQETPVEPG